MDVLRARNRCQYSLLRRCFSKFSISFIHIRRVDQPALVMWYPLKKKDTRFVPSLNAWLARYCLYSMYFLYPEPEDTLMFIRFSCCPHQVLGIIMITRHARTDDCLREVFFILDMDGRASVPIKKTLQCGTLNNMCSSY